MEFENMNIKEYVEKASRTDAPLSSPQEHDIHMVLGIVTEAAELADVFKKSLAYNKEIDWTNVREEFGDLMWYIANFCKSHDFDLEEILGTNIAKLKARYPDKFTEEKANNRHLDVERQVLEFGKKLERINNGIDED
jgi:NTP pyrophosphatase (non-canonical NTP hydrolase)